MSLPRGLRGAGRPQSEDKRMCRPEHVVSLEAATLVLSLAGEATPNLGHQPSSSQVLKGCQRVFLVLCV